MLEKIEKLYTRVNNSPLGQLPPYLFTAFIVLMNSRELINVWMFKNPNNLSVLVWGGYALIALSWALFTLYSRNRILIAMNVFNTLASIAILIGVYIY